MTAFHDKPFDDATQVKLSIFRGYIREWLPVFMTGAQPVTIYDLFAGPGRDVAGNPGSPVIIVDEVKQFCRTRKEQKNPNVSVRMVFNDADEGNVSRLREATQEVACTEPCCHIEFSVEPFQASLDRHMPDIGRSDSASLVIMDQFGVKEVTPDVLRRFAGCKKTDVLFFISSSYARRFAEVPEMRKYIDADADEVRDVDYKCIHRFICQYFRSRLGDVEYYLAPFSIKKGGNIHGVIFGSGHLLGLDKFLTVCWKLDEKTGEANYNIDGDFTWNGDLALLPEDKVVTKVRLFQRDIEDFISKQSPDNRQLYEFCLLRGFSSTKANEVLRAMQTDRRFDIMGIATGKPVRAGAFYLGWDYHKAEPKARFSIGSKA